MKILNIFRKRSHMHAVYWWNGSSLQDKKKGLNVKFRIWRNVLAPEGLEYVGLGWSNGHFSKISTQNWAHYEYCCLGGTWGQSFSFSFSLGHPQGEPKKVGSLLVKKQPPTIKQGTNWEVYYCNILVPLLVRLLSNWEEVKIFLAFSLFSTPSLLYYCLPMV